MCHVYNVGVLAKRIGRHAKPSEFGRIPLGILDLGVFASTFLFRWLTVDFTNDHFQHLSRARQIRANMCHARRGVSARLLGDLPIRDFFDAGFFLQYYLSSAAQLVFGYNLFGEALLTVSLVAFGTMLVFQVSARLSGSRWIAAAAALLTVVAFPRLYNHHKVFLYVAAIGLAWLYAHRGSRWHVSLMAALTALAFLLRHDHGVYIAVMMVCFLGLREWGGAQLWRRLGLYTGVSVGLVLPYLVFLQTTTGLLSYVVGTGSEAQTTTLIQASLQITPLPFKVDRSAPLWVVAPPDERRVNVRWAERATDTARRDREARFGLTRGAHVEDRTWSYVLTDHATGNLRALIQDPIVDDTAGIDRGTFQVVPERWRSWLERKLFLLRLSLAPGVFTAQNALAWYYYLTMLVPIVALGWVGAAWWAGRVARPEAAVVAAAAILCFIISHTLIRGSPDSRLPDVAAPTFVLAAWLARRRGDPRASLVHARLARAGIVSLFLVTFWSVWTVGGTGMTGGLGARVANAGIWDGPAGVWQQLGVVNRRLRDRPIDAWAPPGSTGLRALTRYLLDCTAPSDRILVTWYEPDVFFYAERGFAGGQVYFERGSFGSVADQRLTIERMQRQSVPIIVGRQDQEAEFRQAFPLVYDYVQTRYRLAAESTFGGEQTYLVFVDAQLNPATEHPDLGLPCYREVVVDSHGVDRASPNL